MEGVLDGNWSHVALPEPNMELAKACWTPELTQRRALHKDPNSCSRIAEEEQVTAAERPAPFKQEHESLPPWLLYNFSA